MKLVNNLFILASIACAAFAFGGLFSVIQQSLSSKDSSGLIEPPKPPERIQDVNCIVVKTYQH